MLFRKREEDPPLGFLEKKKKREGSCFSYNRCRISKRKRGEGKCRSEPSFKKLSRRRDLLWFLAVEGGKKNESRAGGTDRSTALIHPTKENKSSL